MTPRTTLSAPGTRRRVRLARSTAITLALLGCAADAHALSSDWLDYTAIAGSRRRSSSLPFFRRHDCHAAAPH